MNRNFPKASLAKTSSRWSRTLRVITAFAALSFLTAIFPQNLIAQDDDPPGRVARLGYMEGSVSFQPAGESDWVEAVPNRPMTTGDKLWADRDSRAEVQLGSASIYLAPDTGFSFLNLDDQTIQIELSSGAISVRVWDLDPNNTFEIDTPNQAFTVMQPGHYRVEASEDGSYTVVTIREGEGESTGNGQSYTLHAGQRTTFSGTDSLNADVEELGGPDAFDNWADVRARRYDDSPSARYCSRFVVGFDDLDDNGDWRPSGEYGYVWFPRVEGGWAPYHVGHWAWIDPWGWTWVDDARWGYAPFHYGRWVWAENRWGWIPGPREQRPIYAPALVVFVGGPMGFGGNVAWFPLGPREVYVPSYTVSAAYVNRVNITNTTVNVTQVTNVYNTTIINKTTTITNVTYVNRGVQGAVTAVPQQAFASAQPVAKVAVAVNVREMATVPISARATVVPQRAAVLGAHANTANHVAAPPAAVASRAVIAKAAPPPPPPPFAARQQVLAQHPGQAVPRQELQKMQPAHATTVALVKRAPPAKPATLPPPHPAGQPANRPGAPAAAPASNARPAATPAPANRPAPAQPAPNNRPAAPAQPQPNNRPAQPPANNNRAPAAQPEKPAPNTRPQPNQPAPNNRPPAETKPAQPAPNNRPAAQPEKPAPNNRPAAQPEKPAPNNRPPAQAKPAQPQQKPPAKPLTPEEKKAQEKKNEEKPQ
jgi:hypothetical protein